MNFFSNNLTVVLISYLLSGFNLEYPTNDKHQPPQRDDKNSDIAPYYWFYEAVMSIYINISYFFYNFNYEKNITIIFNIMALNISAKKR